MAEKILSLYTRFFAIWVVVFGVIAYFFPEPFIAVKRYNELFFGLTMFGIGAVLSVDDFKEIAKRPWIVAIGSFAQFSIMPFGAFLIAKAFHLSDEITLGLVLTGAAPGAMSSNVMCYVAKADTAYSVSLTTVSTLLCPVLTPALTLLLAGSALDVPFMGMMLSVLRMVILPLMVGFAVRHYFSKTIEKVLYVFPAISVTFIIFVCSLVIAINRNYLAQVTGMILVTGVVLNVYGMVSGYGVGKLFKMNIKRRRTLAIEIGMQNAGLGTVLALKHFNERVAIPAAIFVFVCIITASLLAAWWQKVDLKADNAVCK